MKNYIVKRDGLYLIEDEEGQYLFTEDISRAKRFYYEQALEQMNLLTFDLDGKRYYAEIIHVI